MRVSDLNFNKLQGYMNSHSFFGVKKGLFSNPCQQENTWLRFNDLNGWYEASIDTHFFSKISCYITQRYA